MLILYKLFQKTEAGGCSNYREKPEPTHPTPPECTKDWTGKSQKCQKGLGFSAPYLSPKETRNQRSRSPEGRPSSWQNKMPQGKLEDV